jgi:hypothetical protein
VESFCTTVGYRKAGVPSGVLDLSGYICGLSEKNKKRTQPITKESRKLLGELKLPRSPVTTWTRREMHLRGEDTFSQQS